MIRKHLFALIVSLWPDHAPTDEEMVAHMRETARLTDDQIRTVYHAVRARDPYRRPAIYAVRAEVSNLRAQARSVRVYPPGWIVTWRDHPSHAATVRIFDAEREAFEFADRLSPTTSPSIQCQNRRWDRFPGGWSRAADLDEHEADTWRRIEQDRRIAIDTLDSLPREERVALAETAATAYRVTVPTSDDPSTWPNAVLFGAVAWWETRTARTSPEHGAGAGAGARQEAAT